MTKQEIKDVAMVSAIIADHITKKLYEQVQKQGHGYIVTMETIAEWALEFVKKHKNTNWEDALEKGIKPLSNTFGEIICWDDAVIDFAFFKLKEFKTW